VYDAISRLLTLTDPRGATVTFNYDPLDRVTQVADARNGLTAFTYDSNGNLLSVTDPQGQRTTYTYDSLDRAASRTDALGRTERYEYDSAGRLVKVTDRKGQATVFTYDGQDRRTGASYADGSATSWTYDSAGRLVAVADSVSGTIEFGYDALDRLVRETSPQGTITYSHDPLGRRQAMQVNGVAPVAYQHDAASRLTQVAQGVVAVGLAYDAAGRRTSLAYPNGTSTIYTYDPASRLLSLLHQGPSGLLESLTYTYDAAGNRISLLRATGPGPALPGPVQAAYDAANQQLQFNSSTPNLTYDANGNLTSHTEASGTTTYTWDARNRLVGIAGPGVSASFTYDAFGRRISKTVNAVTTQYLYDGNHIAAETGDGGGLATYLRGDTLDEVFARITTSTDFLHTDALVSTVLVTDSSGGIQATYGYDAFGATTVNGTSATPFQYTGRENDGTGLYFYRARYYSPRLQRFLQEDPIGFAGDDLNLYAYVGNAPVTFVDPLGLKKFGPDHTPNENTYTYGEIQKWVNEPGATPEQIADAKASIGAACGRGNDCASRMFDPDNPKNSPSAWQKIVDATGGKDRSGGGSYICVGIPGCYINTCYKCQDGKKTKVTRDPPVPTTGATPVGANKVYYYNDPLKGWCNKQDYKSGCRKCP
jgi:RHS repeat-associated protein